MLRFFKIFKFLSLLYKKCTKVTRKWLKANYWNLAIFLVALGTLIIAVCTLYLEYGVQQQASYPFFDYTYSNGLFRIEGKNDVAITHAEWQLVDLTQTGSSNNQNQLTLTSINGLPLSLSPNEVLDFFANQMGLNQLQNQYAADLVKCQFYPMFSFSGGEEGIPVLVTITYDQNDQQGLTTKDFILITRLDTPDPEIIVPVGGRHVHGDQNIVSLFSKYEKPVITAMGEIAKMPKNDPNYKGQLRANGRCGMSVGQPVEGY